MSSSRTLIVGIGSPHGDDQAGWLVALGLASEIRPRDIDVRQASSPVQLLDWLSGIEQLVICDACRGLGGVGNVRRWDWPARELADAEWSGTHDFSVPAVLDLAESLGQRPRHVVIWTVEGNPRGALAPLSPEVADAIPNMVQWIISDLRATTPCTNSHS